MGKMTIFFFDYATQYSSKTQQRNGRNLVTLSSSQMVTRESLIIAKAKLQQLYLQSFTIVPDLKSRETPWKIRQLASQLLIQSKEYVKKLEATLLFVHFCKAFDSIHTRKTEKILQADWNCYCYNDVLQEHGSSCSLTQWRQQNFHHYRWSLARIYICTVSFLFSA